MNTADDLLNDLNLIGATIQPAGDRLILKAGQIAIPAPLVVRIRQAKRELMAALAVRKDHGDSRTGDENPPTQQNECRTFRHQTHEKLIVQWLDDHPAPSPPGRCAWCGRPESVDAKVVPFGTEPGTHTWLHPECWSGWHRARRAEATNALTILGITPQAGAS